MQTYEAIVSEYSSEADALADFQAVQKLYSNLGIIDTCDAAVLARRPQDKVEIVKRAEEPPKASGDMGPALSLATGLAVALFPASALSMAPHGTFEAEAGHVVAGMRRSDLKNLGEMLDKGRSGLIVVAASHMEPKVDAVVIRSQRRAIARLQADTEQLKREMVAVQA